MDYADCGDLRQLIKSRQQKKSWLNEDDVKYILYQCCLGLEYIHDRNIVHRDIKSDNIFLHNKGTVIKLGDFGIAKVLHSTQSLTQTLVGTPYYFSPELCDDEPYGKMTDIWSLGCVCYELLQLDFPFKAKTLPKLLQVIRTENPKPLLKTYSNSLRSLVKAMLRKESSRRPPVKEILSNNKIDWPLNGIINSDDIFPAARHVGQQPDEEGSKISQENKYSTEICIKSNDSHKIQECSQSSLNGDFESNLYRSWQDVMQDAERNVNHGINIGHQTDQNDASPRRKPDKKIAGKSEEGINTLVSRLEMLKIELSELKK